MSAEEFPDNQKPKEEKKMAEKKEPNNKKGGALDKQGHDLADSFQVEIKTAKKLLKEGKTDQLSDFIFVMAYVIGKVTEYNKTLQVQADKIISSSP